MDTDFELWWFLLWNLIFLKSCKAHCDMKCKVCSKYIYFRLFQAERERDITVEHLADIDRLVNESLQMLSRFQDLNTKVSQKMSFKLFAIFFRILQICPIILCTYRCKGQ